MSMDDILNPQWWAQKAEEYFGYACEAEARKNHVVAALLLRKALLYEARLTGDVEIVKECTAVAETICSASAVGWGAAAKK